MSESPLPKSLDTLPIQRIDARAFLPEALAERWSPHADAETRHAALVSLTHLLGTLTTYLPRRLLRDLFKLPVPGRASGEFLSSTVMFADMSGFTAMSERLTALGREGAETLTGVINDYFTSISSIAARHSGDVIIFGGDAILLLFEGADHALRAGHAAWQMQQTMAERFAEVNTLQGIFNLKMAVGLGSGSIFAAALGSAASMHYTLFGPALAAMGRSEALAGGGRIILDEATHLLAGTIEVAAESEPGYLRLIAEPTAAYIRPDPPVFPPPPADADRQIDWLTQHIAAIVPFLPPGLLPRLLPDPSAALEGEHRPVTVLFIDFRDADALIERLGADDPNAITPRLNAAFDAARSVVARYEGVVNKISTGPSGPHIIAMFGAPTSHEDDPERAVRAAIDIRSALAATDLPGVHRARIGINTGFVYAANVGSRARREYTVMGDQVNLAARLMTSAQPGDIIVSASTAAHVSARFDLDERELVRVKGKAQPQRSFVVRAARGRSVSAAPAKTGELIGRAAEIAMGFERIGSARQGAGQIIAIRGEAGVGKSRLVDALARHARASGYDLFSGACVSYGGSIPYLAWLDPLRALLDLRPSDEEANRRAKIQAALGAIERAEDAPIVADALGVAWADSGWTASLDAQARQHRLFDAVLGLMRHRAARQPLLWVIEDAQWIDPASRDLLDHVARRIDDAAVTLIVAYRPEDGWTGWQAHRESNAVEIDVPPLDRAAIEVLIVDVLGIQDRQLPLTLRTLLERMAAGGLSAATIDEDAFERYWGNPFFAQERVRALIDLGVLARDAAGQWQVTRPIESIEMPDTIHGVIMSRIDRLPEPARRALQVASVIGRSFDLEVLQAVYDSPNETLASLRRHLIELADLGVAPLEAAPVDMPASSSETLILRSPFRVQHSKFAFRNITTQEVAYASLRYERRRELHRRIGEYIENRVRSGDDQSGLLTYHYFEGQMWDKALTFALAAGWRAQHAYANAAAASAYRRAVQAAEAIAPPRVLEQMTAHEALGDVLVITGEYDAALQHYARARTLAEGDARHLADLCRKTAEACERRSEFETAFTWISQGLGYAEPHSLEAARIHLMAAGILHRQGKQDQARDECERSQAISHTITDDAARRAEAHALYLLAGIYYKRGELTHAIQAAQQAVSGYLLVGDVLGQSQALNTLAAAHADLGDFSAAARCYTDSLHLKERIGDIAGQAMITLNLGENYRSLGELDAARRAQMQSLRIWRELGNTYAVALLHNNLAATALAERHWDEAARQLAQSEMLFGEIGSEDFKTELQRHLAELALGQGQIDEALALAEQSVSAAEASDEKLEIALSRRVLGEARLARGDVSRAEDELRRSLDMLETIGSSVEAANTRVALARAVLQQGRSDEARRLTVEAIQAYDAAGAESLKARVQAVIE